MAFDLTIHSLGHVEDECVLDFRFMGHFLGEQVFPLQMFDCLVLRDQLIKLRFHYLKIY